MDILQMSFSAAVLITAVVLLRALTLYKLPKKTFLVLWGVVLCRLLLPFSIPSRLSFYTLIGYNGAAVSANPPAGTAHIASPAVTAPLPDLGAAHAGSAVGGGTPAQAVSPLMLLWLIGMCACVVFFIIAYVRCRREFKTALPVENDFIARWQQNHPMRLPVQVLQSDRIKAPLTYGVFRPVVLLPKAMDYSDEEKLQYILAHEYTHIKRFDALTKLLLTSALCVHWFNPFVWLMFALANRDIELSCDETVVKTFGETTKSSYALALIGLEEKKSRLTPLCNNFSKNAIEDRITAIMKIKKYSIPAIIAAVLLVAGVIVAFATSKASDGKPADAQDNTEILASASPSPDDTTPDASQGPVEKGSDFVIDSSLPGITPGSPPDSTPGNIGVTTAAPVADPEAAPQVSPDDENIVNLDWVWPCEGDSVTSPFGIRFHPIYHKYILHDQIDIAGEEGDAVYAALDGTVSEAGFDDVQGNYIVIDHGNGAKTNYQHLSELLVSVEDTVAAGDTIAKVGSTGDSTGPHLAFGVNLNGQAVNPLKYYKDYTRMNP